VARVAQGWGRTDLLMLLAVTIWGINFTALKVALAYLAPAALNALRFSGAALLMLAILAGQAIRTADPSLMRIRRRDWIPIILLGLVGHGLYHMLFAFGLARTSPANSSLLLATMPIWVAILGRVTGVERINRVMWGGILLSFVGIITLVTGGGKVAMGGGTLLGDLMLVGCSILWAVYTTASKPFLARYSPVALTAWTMAAASVPLVLAGIPDLQRQDWASVPMLAWAGLSYSVLLSVGVGYIIYSTSVQRVGNARTAVYSNLTPVVAILFAWLALGDALTLLQLLGGAIVLAGLVVTRKGRASSSGGR
jgi:drug/metabolite transporter (DMT)-like permease